MVRGELEPEEQLPGRLAALASGREYQMNVDERTLEKLQTEMKAAHLHHEATMTELDRAYAQIKAMGEEIERLRATVERHEATIRGLWGELAGKDEGGGMKDE